MGDGRPTCNRVLTSGSVGMGIPMGIPVGMGWVWGLKCHPHGSPGCQSDGNATLEKPLNNDSFTLARSPSPQSRLCGSLKEHA